MYRRRRKLRLRRLLKVFVLGSLVCSWCLILPAARGQTSRDATIIQPQAASQLVSQGVELYEAGDLQEAIARWQQALAFYRNNDPVAAAVVLENLGRATRQQGDNERAIDYWQQAIAYYRQLNQPQQVGRLSSEQAQAYSSIGQPRRAIAILCGFTEEKCAATSALQIARSAGDALGEAAALGSLGEAYRLRGDYQRAVDYLEASSNLARQIQTPAYLAAALNGLGNTYIAQAKASQRRAAAAESRGDSIEAAELKQEASNHNSQALKYFQDSLKVAANSGDRPRQIQALLSAIPAYYHTGKTEEAKSAWRQASLLLPTLPDRDKVYAAINLADWLQPRAALEETVYGTKCLQPDLHSQAIALLQQAVAIAQRLNDFRSESFALGELGRVYECQANYQQALSLTQQARWSAEQNLNAKDSLYLWEWQAGRIYQALGQQSEAIAAYQRAIATLEEIREDMLVASRELQFDFRDTVEPVYRQAIAIELEAASASPNRFGERLDSVIATVDALKLAELENYFGEDCAIATREQARADLVETNPATAVFNTIVLDDRTAIIVSFPDGRKRFEWLEVERETLNRAINQYRRSLESYFDFFNPQQAQQVYDWLIRPFAKDLERSQIKTLVFSQDGILRSVPMAALHDGEQFLIQKYAIATTPSLTLTDLQPLNRERLRGLLVGVTESTIVDGRRLPPLNYVDNEIEAIAAQLAANTQLINEEFTLGRLQQELSQTAYSLVHIATHGEFGAVSEDTFIATGNNQKLTPRQLDLLFSRTTETQSVELVTLSACQTAIGDERAALGLAGIAVQAGAKSALASLWYIEDAATAQLVAKFYQSLSDSNLSKAQALQNAQLALLETEQYAHPAYWAAFVLIGNWL